ncbi:hypothetical protein [Verrucomicrobium sp. BvORR106]|uniref:hypothetical protein n=1 Tax=Verrucomicrobium sp. BvORR106 TaxID=1403819 RepID=UPI00056F6540|nr:hypothetical protein [Verrucomicrobium sp. BvORR106]
MMKPLVLCMLVAVGATVSAAESWFTCSISAENTVVRHGEHPKVKVRIGNHLGRDVVLVGSLDGSSYGMRYPKCGFELMDSQGKPLKISPESRCGNMNELRIEDFVTVPSGKEFNPYESGFFGSWQSQLLPQLPPGTYLIRFYYQTSRKGVQYYFGDEQMLAEPKISPAIQKLYEMVPGLDLKSNALKITITAKSPPPSTPVVRAK